MFHLWRWCHLRLCTPLHPDLQQLLVQNSPVILYTVSANFLVLFDLDGARLSWLLQEFHKFLKTPNSSLCSSPAINISAWLCAGSISEKITMKSAACLFTITHSSSLTLSNLLSRCFMRFPTFTTIICMAVESSELSQIWFGQLGLRS